MKLHAPSGKSLLEDLCIDQSGIHNVEVNCVTKDSVLILLCFLEMASHCMLRTFPGSGHWWVPDFQGALREQVINYEGTIEMGGEEGGERS